MRLNGLTAVLLLAGLPLCSIASPYQTLARDAENSARWACSAVPPSSTAPSSPTRA